MESIVKREELSDGEESEDDPLALPGSDIKTDTSCEVKFVKHEILDIEFEGPSNRSNGDNLTEKSEDENGSDDEYKPSKAKKTKNVSLRKKLRVDDAPPKKIVQHRLVPLPGTNPFPKIVAKQDLSYTVKQNFNELSKNCVEDPKVGGRMNRTRGKKAREQPELLHCDLCDFTSKRADNLVKHKETHIEKTYACDECEKVCSNMPDLKRHKIIHNGHKPFACDQCGYRTSQVIDLKEHRATHTECKPFACDQCNFKCNHSVNLRRHKMKHEGKKPYACNQCDFICSQMQSLKNHKFIHTGDKPFACDQCDFKSTQLRSLQRHKLSHTGEKPFACDECNSRYTRLENLRYHKLAHLPDV